MKEHTKFRMVTETELLGHLKKTFFICTILKGKKNQLETKSLSALCFWYQIFVTNSLNIH